ncbi:MAG TPA: putative baseplate assembly protein [Ktedonobacterales bacterium]|nr:putative baseplate assembly protein [Ktedonobacterales bacterium]
MTIPAPHLDDRDFHQLVEQARAFLTKTCPEWTDLSPSDPGMTLLEAFAFLTDTMIYRLNRLPEKAYIEFLRLLGLQLAPPAAAAVTLVFTLAQAAEQPVEIPRGTRVTVGRAQSGSEPPIFTTAQTVSIAVGETQVSVLAYHCEYVIAELVAVSTGLPGMTFTVQRAPIIAPTGDEIDLVVAVEARPEDLIERASAIEHNGKTYRVWREVDGFANTAPDDLVYTADRATGRVSFAPALQRLQPDQRLEELSRALAAVPAAGREIRVWYRRGGGNDGNVAAGTLTVLKDPIAGVTVTNPQAATGGQAPETLENALIRGPLEFRTLRRAVTVSDFEQIALASSRAIARAHAFTRAAAWSFAKPGSVEVLLVPDVDGNGQGTSQLSPEMLQAQQVADSRALVQQALDQRKILGTTCVVNWAHYKTVSVHARIVARREEDAAAVKQRILERLALTISPLPTRFNPTGWGFGQALRVSNVYDIALAEPGVRWVDGVEFLVDDVPTQQVAGIIVDNNQPNTWYAASGPTLYRTLNDGDSWEPVGQFPNERVRRMCSHPNVAGLVAMATLLPENQGSRVYISTDCGENWLEENWSFEFEVQDMAWTIRDDVPLLLLATSKGLYELKRQPGAVPVQVLVDPTHQDRGMYAVVVATDVRGTASVAVAAQATAGVYLSRQGGSSESFRLIGMAGQDIRTLAVQYNGPRSFLWAGIAASGPEDKGKGCFSWELTGPGDPPDGWRTFSQGWSAGSCHRITFADTTVLAATFRSGIMRLDSTKVNPSWTAANVQSGLPLRDPGRFYPVDDLALNPTNQIVLTAGSQGIFRSADRGSTFQPASSKRFTDKVLLPRTWLFCSGDHDITVVNEDEAR